MTMQIHNEGIYNSLIAQLDKLAHHNRQGSYRTKERYYKAMKRFCRFLAEEYHLQKLANVAPKHLNAYIAKLQSEGKSASTIKTDLAAIRFFHDKMDAKHPLPGNGDLAVKLERRRFGGVDRSWSRREFGLFLFKCWDAGHEDYAAVATLTYYVVLRIHECFRLDTAVAENALRTGAITVKGKGGKIRSIPINESIRTELKKMLTVTPRGHKLFVSDDVPTHIAMGRFQQFICAVRDEIRDPDSTRPMTHHGLRHTYAARTYQELIDSGISPANAHYQVSRLLGHERPDVTDIYLAALTPGGDSNG